MFLSKLPQLVYQYKWSPSWRSLRCYRKLGTVFGIYARMRWGVCRAGRVRVVFLLLLKVLVSIAHIICTNMTVGMLLFRGLLHYECICTGALQRRSKINACEPTQLDHYTMLGLWLG